MPYRFAVPRPFKDSEQEYLEFGDDVPMDEAIDATDKYYTNQYLETGITTALAAAIKGKITSEDFLSGLGDKLDYFMETINLAVNGKNKYTDPTSEYYNPEYKTTQEEAIPEIISILGLAGRGLGPTGGAGTAGMFIGPKGIGSTMLKKFEAAEKAGKGKNAIWNELGLYKGPEGLVRGEISDDKSKFNKLARQYIEANPNYEHEYNLKDVLEHPTLYGFYPELENMGVKIKIDSKMRGGHYDPNDGTIEITARNMDEAHSILLHEVQHSIQDIEGFAFGGSRKTLDNYITNIQSKAEKVNLSLIDDVTKTVGKFDFRKYKGSTTQEKQQEWINKAIEKNPKLKDKVDAVSNARNVLLKLNKVKEKPDGDYEFYRSLYGEIEAVNTQNRRVLSQEERMDIPPWLTEQDYEHGKVLHGYRK